MNTDVTQFLKDLFHSSELNCLPPEYGGHRLFKDPVIGVSAGNDPLIAKFKEVVTPTHLTPAEMWSKSASSKRRGQDDLPIGSPQPDAGTWTDLEELAARLKVLSIVFPYTRSILEDGSKSTERTPLTGLALNRAHVFHSEVYKKTAQFFIDNGYRVMAPQKSRFHSILLTFSKPHIVSVWSERHYAFAAGLGSFGLAEHLITEHGCNIRLASFITDAPLEVTPRTNDDPFANCLHFAKGGCGKCAARCPGRALTKDAHGKVLCEFTRRKVSATIREELTPFLEPVNRHVWYFNMKDHAIGCGICQFDVPCMDKNPMADREQDSSED